MVGMGIRMMMVPVVIMPMRMVVMMVMRVLMIMVMVLVMVVIVRVVVIMVVRMIVIMVVPVRMIVMRVQGRPRQSVQPAKSLITARRITVSVAGTVFQPSPDPFNMMMMARLRQPDLRFKAENLLAVLAHLAIHHRSALENFLKANFKSIQNQRMIIEITGLEKLDVRISLSNNIGKAVNAFHQYTCEQEVRENDNAFVSQFGSMFEARFDERESDTGIAGLCPAKAHALPQHPHNLADIGVGIRV